MAQKRLELIGARQHHLAESVQSPLERRKDAARFGAVSQIGSKDQGRQFDPRIVDAFIDSFPETNTVAFPALSCPVPKQHRD